VNEANTVTVLTGITGSVSGGMGIALAAMGETCIQTANTANIPLKVLHHKPADSTPSRSHRQRRALGVNGGEGEQHILQTAIDRY